MNFTSVNGITLHYAYQTGIGPPLVFVNSLGSDLRIWDDVIAHLSGRACVRHDKRGHGLSGRAPAPYRMRDHAADLLALLDHLNIERAIVVGISIGGMIAQEFALWQPGRVAGLILCDTGAKIGTPDSWNERIAAVETGGVETIADAVIARWLTPEFAQANPDATRGWRAMLTATPATGYAGSCAALRDTDLRADAPGITTPTLVVCGAQDPSTTPELNQALAALIPGAQYLEIPDAAHLPCIEQPAAMAAAITAFATGLAQPDAYARGMTRRRSVLGDAHVDRAEANKTQFDADFQRWITESVWGGIWTRPGLDTRTRHLLTITLLAGLGKEHELAMHLRATRNTGVTQDEVREALMQVAVYAGVPAANSAIAVAKAVFAEGGG